MSETNQAMNKKDFAIKLGLHQEFIYGLTLEIWLI